MKLCAATVLEWLTIGPTPRTKDEPLAIAHDLAKICSWVFSPTIDAAKILETLPKPQGFNAHRDQPPGFSVLCCFSRHVHSLSF